MGKLRKIMCMVASVVAMSAAVLVIAPAAAQAAPVPCGRKVLACIDLSAQRAWLMDGKGHVTYGGVRITSGRPGYRTPVGGLNLCGPGTFPGGGMAGAAGANAARVIQSDS